MKLNKEQIDDLLFRQRPFTIKIDGIWRAVMGVYHSPIKDPLSAKCILNGKEIVIQSPDYIDYTGCNLRDLDAEIIRLNMNSLPPAPKRKTTLYVQAQRLTRVAEEQQMAITDQVDIIQ